jgi:hypothetical protein
MRTIDCSRSIWFPSKIQLKKFFFEFKLSFQKIGLSNEDIHYLSNKSLHDLLNIHIQQKKKKQEED